MAVPHLEKSGNGNIVFVSSVAGYSPIDGIGAYSVMKSALLGINRTMSQSLANRNIRVNAIAPGIFFIIRDYKFYLMNWIIFCYISANFKLLKFYDLVAIF